MRNFGILVLTTLFLSVGACIGDGDDDTDDSAVDSGGDDTAECRVATVDPADSYADRYEGTGFDNSCTVDEDCVVGGCSGEVCAAESVDSTCEVVPLPTGTCGCVANECIWYAACP